MSSTGSALIQRQSLSPDKKHLAHLKDTVHGHTSSGGDEKQTATGISISPTTHRQQMGPKFVPKFNNSGPNAYFFKFQGHRNGKNDKIVRAKCNYYGRMNIHTDITP
jgi:hypothetical protein